MSALFVLAEAHKHPSWADFGPVEWVAVVVAGIAAMWTVWKAVMYTLRPGEEDPDHIKRSILFDEVLQVTSGFESTQFKSAAVGGVDVRPLGHPKTDGTSEDGEGASR